MPVTPYHGEAGEPQEPPGPKRMGPRARLRYFQASAAEGPCFCPGENARQSENGTSAFFKFGFPHQDFPSKF
jgi:hypothetical protein